MDIETRNSEILKEWVGHPGTKLVAQRLRAISRKTLLQQTRLSPFTDADKIVQSQQLRFVLNILIPQIIEDAVNYDEESPAKQVRGKHRWDVMEWLKGLFAARL